MRVANYYYLLYERPLSSQSWNSFLAKLCLSSFLFLLFLFWIWQESVERVISMKRISWMLYFSFSFVTCKLFPRNLFMVYSISESEVTIKKNKLKIWFRNWLTSPSTKCGIRRRANNRNVFLVDGDGKHPKKLLGECRTNIKKWKSVYELLRIFQR